MWIWLVFLLFHGRLGEDPRFITGQGKEVCPGEKKTGPESTVDEMQGKVSGDQFHETVRETQGLTPSGECLQTLHLANACKHTPSGECLQTHSIW